ncbi:hypothetical protein V6Z11_D12G145200 [Gossypium hirsutum]
MSSIETETPLFREEKVLALLISLHWFWCVSGGGCKAYGLFTWCPSVFQRDVSLRALTLGAQMCFWLALLI